MLKESHRDCVANLCCSPSSLFAFIPSILSWIWSSAFTQKPLLYGHVSLRRIVSTGFRRREAAMIRILLWVNNERLFLIDVVYIVRRIHLFVSILTSTKSSQQDCQIKLLAKWNRFCNLFAFSTQVPATFSGICIQSPFALSVSPDSPRKAIPLRAL